MQKFQKIFCLLFFIVVHPGYAQTSFTDSLQIELRSAISDSSKCLIKGQLGYYYAQRNYDSAKHYLNSAVRLAESNKFDLLQVRFLCFMAMAQTINGELEPAIISMKQAAQVASNNALDSALAQTHFGLGNVLHAKGDITGSLDYYLKALTYFEEHNQAGSVIRTKGSLSVLYLTLEEFDKAAELIKETNQFHLEHGSQIGLMNGYQRLSSVYREKSKFDSALYILNEAREIAIRLEDPFSLSVIENSIGGVFFEMEVYSQAIVHYRNSISSQENVGMNAEELMSTYARLAMCLAIRNKDAESRRYISLAEKQLEKSESIEFQMFYYQMKYKIDSVNENYKQSLVSHQKFMIAKDRLFDVEQSKQFAELEAQYETEKNETEIASLSQQATIQALEIDRKNIGILISVVLLVVIAIVAYLIIRQRNLKGAQVQVELEQRFLRSQLNPHFISNALLAVQNFMLKKQPEEAAVYLSKFAKLMRETLENSRQEFILVEDELQMLTNFMDIHKMRMNESFDYHIHLGDNIDPETDTIPPMFVQPFVENAIEHGIIHAKGHGKIDLHFEKEGEYISIVVKDNGGGFAQDQTGVTGRNSLSSTIIQERMTVFNKTLKRKIKLMLANIENESGEIQGSKVELKVPFSYL